MDKQILKNKKIQWATSASIDCVIYLDCWHFKLKANFKQNKKDKGQSKKNRDQRTMRIIV